jgi:hypothetical protein
MRSDLVVAGNDALQQSSNASRELDQALAIQVKAFQQRMNLQEERRNETSHIAARHNSLLWPSYSGVLRKQSIRQSKKCSKASNAATALGKLKDDALSTTRTTRFLETTDHDFDEYHPEYAAHCSQTRIEKIMMIDEEHDAQSAPDATRTEDVKVCLQPKRTRFVVPKTKEEYCSNPRSQRRMSLNWPTLLRKVKGRMYYTLPEPLD